MMRFLLDEDVTIKLIHFFRNKGHNIERVPSGIKNGEVIAIAKQEKRILITRDKGFSDTIVYPPAQFPGIICLRIHPPLLEKLVAALDSLLNSIPENSFEGKLFIVEEKGYHQLL